MRIRKILVPYDGSKFSEKSLKFAINLAKAFFAENQGKEDIKLLD